MRGLLVRVGIDSTSGGWNAPVDTKTRQFAFVPIPDHRYNQSGKYLKGGKRTYEEEKGVLYVLEKFSSKCGQAGSRSFQLPSRLNQEAMHLDPDFCELTYGDSPKRGKRLREFKEGDFLAFYAGLRSIHDGKLFYALIGMLKLESKPVGAAEVKGDKRLRNAHCRWSSCREGDLVAFGKDGLSGLLEKCIPIGEWRDKAYRVTNELVEEWGGFENLPSGNITRSGTLPEFKCPEKFMKWFEAHDIKLSRAQYKVASS